MEDCVFCKIVNGSIPCYKLYEDDDVLAFLDINPLSKGHTLVLPKRHSKDIFEITEDDLCKVMSVVKLLSKKIDSKLNPLGIIVNQNNRVAGGQSVFHLHIHIKPIFDDTKTFSEVDHRKALDADEMNEIQKLISWP